MTTKQLQKQNLDELMKQTLLNILSAKGIIYTYYKNKKLTQGNNEIKITDCHNKKLKEDHEVYQAEESFIQDRISEMQFSGQIEEM